MYQLGKLAVSAFRGNPPPTRWSPQSLDSGYIVESTQGILPQTERTYDIVVLGVTGLTGRLAARYLAQTYGVPKRTSNQAKGGAVNWAVAGRSELKVRQVLEELAVELNVPELVTRVEIVVVDTSLPSTLPRLVHDTRVVATTAGPYSLYGSSVVEFCAKFGTHYVDITGETTWVKTMMNQWQSTAQQTGAILVPFCGHDSIPW